MAGGVREGERVRVHGMGRRVIYRGELRRFDGNVAYVVPDGKSKALPVPLERVSPEERRAPAPEPVTVVPVTERPELEAVPREPAAARDEGYLAFVRQHPCASCGSRKLVEAHHWARVRALAKRVDDYRTVPLCHDCHTEFHDTGSLQAWSAKQTRVWFLVAQNELLVEWAIRGRQGTAA